MENFEITYYLSGQQLLLLLSLIDQRPVAGLPPVEAPEDWQKISLSLFEEGRLYFENGQCAMDQELSALLLTMKDAEQICAIYGKRPSPSVQLIYQGKQLTLLELLSDGKNRLRRIEPAEAGQMLMEILMPAYPMPEALLDSLTENQIISSSLSRWESQSASLVDSVPLWMQIPEVVGVLDRWSQGIQTRWIWIEDMDASLVLFQAQGETRSILDTASYRRALLRELRLEV